jgi:hypothetical protein
MHQIFRGCVVAGILVALILLAGCDGGQQSGSTPTPAPTTLPTNTITITTPTTTTPTTTTVVPVGVQFTHVSPCHDFGGVEGRVTGVDPAKYKIVVYINVAGLWWGPKPYWDNPLTDIQRDGTWSTEIVTGGNDQDAAKVSAFLVPSGFSPPRAEGSRSLPAGLSGYPSATAQRC